MSYVNLVEYDEYVNDFERIRKNPEVQPWTEDEVRERADVTNKGEDFDLQHHLHAEDAVDGMEHVFCFDLRMETMGYFCVTYMGDF